MKNKIIAIVGALTLTLALPMTAFAKPSAETQYAPSGVFDNVAYAQHWGIDNDTSVANNAQIGIVSTKFMDSVCKTLENFYGPVGKNITIFDASTVRFNGAATQTYSFVDAEITAQDNLQVLLYNETTGDWDWVTAVAQDGKFYFNANNNYTRMIVVGLGQLTNEQIVKNMTAIQTDIKAYLNGGKDSMTPLPKTAESNMFTAPNTGDTTMIYVIIAGAACAAAFAASKKKLSALN